jgi:hypothetical protein
MTEANNEYRLDRLEAIAENVLLSIQQQQQQFQSNQVEMGDCWRQQQQQNQLVQVQLQEQRHQCK